MERTTDKPWINFFALGEADPFRAEAHRAMDVGGFKDFMRMSRCWPFRMNAAFRDYKSKNPPSCNDLIIDINCIHQHKVAII